MRCAIVGGGVLGRVLALELLKNEAKVEIYDTSPAVGEGSAAFHAGGMLAPYSELESAEPIIFALGISGRERWSLLSKDLEDGIGFTANGSLIVSHHRDEPLWQEIAQKICSQVSPQDYSFGPAQQFEAELQEGFSRSLLLPLEGHVDPRLFLKESFRFTIENGALWHHLAIPRLSKAELKSNFKDFDWVFDTRGIGAQKDQRYLRGVRGEAVLVHAPEVNISRPVRVMHPRYSLYIVPRSGHQFYLGATQIERDDDSPITIRSTLELLSAAYAVHRGFGEAQIIDTCVARRPAYMDNLPRITVQDRLLRINGLYRHGFLLSPVIAAAALAFVQHRVEIPFKNDLFKGEA